MKNKITIVFLLITMLCLAPVSKQMYTIWASDGKIMCTSTYFSVYVSSEFKAISEDYYLLPKEPIYLSFFAEECIQDTIYLDKNIEYTIENHLIKVTAYYTWDCSPSETDFTCKSASHKLSIIKLEDLDPGEYQIEVNNELLSTITLPSLYDHSISSSVWITNN